jgi:hypothetical protein
MCWLAERASRLGGERGGGRHGVVRNGARLLAAFDEDGVGFGNGFGDRMTWHCLGLLDITSGMPPHRGYCVGTDLDGDQLAGDVAANGK